MAKFALKLQARELRKKGLSIKEIAKVLSIPRSTSSVWVRDIVLSIEQLEKLRKNEIIGSERGRLEGARINRLRRAQMVERQRTLGYRQ